MLRKRHVNSNSTMPIKIDKEPLEYVEEFTNRRGAISTDNGAQKDKASLNEASCEFVRLKNI